MPAGSPRPPRPATHAGRRPGGAAPTRRPGALPPTIEGVAEPAGTAQAKPAPQPGPGAARLGRLPFSLAAGRRGRMPEALRGFLDQVSQGGLQLPGGGLGGLSAGRRAVAVPDGAQFLAATFSNEAGSRPYKLYVPSGYRAGQPVPLVVMLHGCTQSPDDFAAGTRMNEAAEEHTCLVAYPGQTARRTCRSAGTGSARATSSAAKGSRR